MKNPDNAGKIRQRCKPGEMWNISFSSDYFRIRGFLARKGVLRDIVIEVLIEAARQSQYFTIREITEKANELCRQRNITPKATPKKIYDMIYSFHIAYKSGKGIMGVNGYPVASRKIVNKKARLAFRWSYSSKDMVFKGH